ncbi:hypothetical protein H072_4498 [Dactylellina haptotyla CBS 200.50]|uniref:Transferase n=1 Tax=Dactylellina haptotyla (strain CBS 200.50) TaxID=1284197 RepID=S8AFD4_DACHA|nr:hypothetical protein H072_4498 [Dactylellina haptotyla CBS 200.50]
MGSIEPPGVGSTSEWPQEYTLKTNEPLAQDCVTVVCLGVSGRLDVGFLKEKHGELVQRWPVLGGLLVTKQSPYSMTTGDNVDFEHREIDSKLIDVAPVDFELSKHEREGDKPVIRPYRTGKQYLTVPDLYFGAVSTLNITVGTLFAIRVTLLQDATIIAFKFSHFFIDGQGCYDVIEQYNNLLWGKQVPRAVPPPGIHKKLSEMISGHDTMPVEPPEKGGWEYNRNFLQVGSFGLVSTIAQTILSDYSAKIGLTEPVIEKHIYLPPRFIEMLQESCQMEINDLRIGGEEKIKLSKMDVINAWWLKRIYSNLRGSIVLNMGYAFNFGDKIPQNPTEKYFQGHYYGLYVPMGTVADLKEQSIAQTALKIRRNVSLAKQPSVIRANLEYLESIQTEKIIPTAKGGENEGSPLFSSWNRFPFEKLDFSPALKGSPETGRVIFNNPRIVLPLNIKWKPKLLFFNDPEGGIWCQSMQLPSHWKGFEDINDDERIEK